jgi:hypothetical protein
MEWSRAAGSVPIAAAALSPSFLKRRVILISPGRNVRQQIKDFFFRQRCQQPFRHQGDLGFPFLIDVLNGDLLRFLQRVGDDAENLVILADDDAGDQLAFDVSI